MTTNVIEVKNKTGLHTRPGNLLVQLAKTYDCNIMISNEAGKEVKATSLLKLLSLGIKEGAKIKITAEGSGEKEAVEKISELLSNLKD